MRLGVILMSVLLGVTGCKGKKHSASKVVNFKHGESVTISATSMNDTSIKWAAHAVDWETKKGFVLSMTVGARPTVVLEHFSDAKLQRKAMESFEQFPEKVRAAWMEKAMGPHSKFGAEGQARIYRLMKKWTDCETFKAFGMAHLGIEQKRKDCPNWPLKRFPSDGEAGKKLQTFLAEGKRNEAIRLVRQTTGWEYGKSVDFVDARAQDD